MRSADDYGVEMWEMEGWAGVMDVKEAVVARNNGSTIDNICMSVTSW